MSNLHPGLLALAIVLGLAPLAAQAPGVREPVRFDRDIRPLLSDRCFACHGADAGARKADLRLDTWEGLTGAIANGADFGEWTPANRAAVVPGAPERSMLLLRIEATDPQRVMPPPSSHKQLSQAEKALLRRWIVEGADFRDHWAFVPPQSPPVPSELTGWARTPVDHFVAARLDAAGLTPPPTADRETLIRRVALDLTGLPPTLAELERFLRIPGDDWYTDLVDHYLASPHYGERMAQVWLDAARYADTNGFHHDNVRTAWPYRDWVLDAFNSNKPYDEFLVEQLAGDLIADSIDPTAQDVRELDQLRIATAFARMHNINDEGGAIDQEYRVEAIADRIETIATATMGLTFTCARCHDHKYDPFTQEDYYSLWSYFNSIDERGVYSNNFEQARAYPPRLMFAPDALRADLDAARSDLAAAERALAEQRPRFDAERAAWEEQLRNGLALAWDRVEAGPVTVSDGARLPVLEDGSVRVPGRPESETITFSFVSDATDLRVVAFDALADPSFPDGRVGLAPNGNAVVSAITAKATSLADPSKTHDVEFVWAWADHEQPNNDHDIHNLFHTEGRDWALDGHRVPGDRGALLIAREPFGFEGGTRIEVEIACRSRYGQHVVGRPRVRLATSPADTATLLARLPVVAGDWYEAGPFAEQSFEAAWQTAHGPEATDAIDTGLSFGKVAWKHRPDIADDQLVALRGERSAFYFGRTLRTPIARRVTLSLGSDDGVQVFLDGRPVLERKVMRGAAAGQDRVELALSPGEHQLVVKVVNNGGPGGFVARLIGDRNDPEPLEPLAWLPSELRSADAAARLTGAFGRRSPSFAALDDARVAAEQRLAQLDEQRVPVLVMKEAPEPVPAFVLTRGTYDGADPDRPVTRRPPAPLGLPLPEGAPNDRLGFARWLTRPDHPLTARVHVNRLWQTLFGEGLVATQENFGQQGEWPSHPELLDWLATRFVATGWNQKALLRLILHSSVYRQEARATSRALEIDPANRLLSYFPRRRLAGEFVRDLALAAAGLLVETVGGPSVRPYQPDGLWRAVSIGGSSNTQVFRRDDGDALFRRSLYTFWKRTSPNPQMSTFDAPSREFCVVERNVTNTPLQALVLWNDEQFVEAARHLATRVLDELPAPGDEARRLERLFRLATARRPDAATRDILVATLGDFRARYAARPEDAAGLLSPGSTEVPADADAIELAAWTMLASTVLNLDETLVRD